MNQSNRANTIENMDRSTDPASMENPDDHPGPPMVRRLWLLVGLALLAIAFLVAGFLIVLGVSTMGGAAPPVVHIAFSSNQEGSFQIYAASVVNLGNTGPGASVGGAVGAGDGEGYGVADAKASGGSLHPTLTAITRLTDDQGTDLYPAWSPDGRKIAYSSDREGHANIYVMNADGSGQVALTQDAQGNAHPVWSPDGKRIAFKSDRLGDWDIWVMNADGSGQSRLTTLASEEDNPTWSPDSQHIAFDSWATGNTQIYAMKADGTDKARLTTDFADDWAPAWSPDGQRIAFASNRDGPARIYVMNRDGSGQVALSTGDLYGTDEDPAWSPDGRYIIFASKDKTEPGPRSGLFIVPTGRPLEVVQLVSSLWLDRDPALAR